MEYRLMTTIDEERRTHPYARGGTAIAAAITLLAQREHHSADTLLGVLAGTRFSLDNDTLMGWSGNTCVVTIALSSAQVKIHTPTPLGLGETIIVLASLWLASMMVDRQVFTSPIPVHAGCKVTAEHGILLFVPEQKPTNGVSRSADPPRPDRSGACM